MLDGTFTSYFGPTRQVGIFANEHLGVLGVRLVLVLAKATDAADGSAVVPDDGLRSLTLLPFFHNPMKVSAWATTPHKLDCCRAWAQEHLRLPT